VLHPCLHCSRCLSPFSFFNTMSFECMLRHETVTSPSFCLKISPSHTNVSSLTVAFFHVFRVISSRHLEASATKHTVLSA